MDIERKLIKGFEMEEQPDLHDIIRDILKPNIPKIEEYILNNLLDSIIDVCEQVTEVNMSDHRNKIRGEIMQRFGNE